MNFKLAEHIIFQNDDFVAINKPSGLLTIPDREGKDVSLKTVLKIKFGEIFTVHRLDRDTSGFPNYVPDLLVSFLVCFPN